MTRPPLPARPSAATLAGACWFLLRFLAGVGATAGLLLLAVAPCVVPSSCDLSADATAIRLLKLEQRMQMFAAQHGGRWPGSLPELVAALGDDGWPRDAWGHPILVLTTPEGVSLVSLGRDGELGGQGADADQAQVVWSQPGA